MKKVFSSLSGMFLLVGSLIWLAVLGAGIYALMAPGTAPANNYAVWVGIPPCMYAISLVFHFTAEKQ